MFSLYSQATTNHNSKSLTTGNSCSARLYQTTSSLSPLKELFEFSAAKTNRLPAGPGTADLHFKNTRRHCTLPSGIRYQSDRLWENTAPGSELLCLLSTLRMVIILSATPAPRRPRIVPDPRQPTEFPFILFAN